MPGTKFWKKKPKKEKKREIRAEDGFVRSVTHFWERIQPYIPAIVISIGVIVAVLLIVNVLRDRGQAQAEAASVKLSKILEMDVSRKGNEPDARPRSLRSFLLMPPPDAEKDKEIDGAKLDESVQKLSALSREYANTSSHPQILLWLGKTFAFMGGEENQTKAKDAYAEIVEKYPEFYVYDLARLSLGKTYFELKLYREAAKQFASLSDLRPEWNAVSIEAKWYEACCYEFLHQYEKARKTYEAVRSQPEGSFWRSMAEFRLAQLKSEIQKEVESKEDS